VLWAAVAGRALGLLALSLLGWRILDRELDFNSTIGSLRFLHGIDGVIHEAGHAFALYLPRFLHVLAGSAVQVLLPAVCAWTFLQQRQPGSFAVALFWTGESVTDVAIYVADAKKRALPLLGGDPAGHDWNYLLGPLGLLNWAQLLGRLTFGLGIVMIAIALGILANETYRAWQRAARA
jgi:hypothetical protein